jgi:SAM-dependent methyltransferase
MAESLDQMIETTWPAEGLERVEACPVCGSGSRSLLYEGLRDRIFFCAPGEWTLYRCDNCRSGYLDPRPTRQTIHLAYREYFTHKRSEEIGPSLDRPFARIFANGYRNRRYGTKDRPSSWLGVLVKALQPGRRAQIDAEMRHLPRPWPGGSLLDVGCGNGLFLGRARDMGWRVVGVEPDPEAAAVASSRGLDVRIGGIEVLTGVTGEFDWITMSHVIEHVHDPTNLLRACHRLLRPGGRIWIETPNLDSLGHSIYGPSWRDLDPPRHLALFTYSSLRQAVSETGFANVQDEPHPPVCEMIFGASEAIAAGRDPQAHQFAPLLNGRAARKADRFEDRRPRRHEFITVTACKSVIGKEAP